VQDQRADVALHGLGGCKGSEGGVDVGEILEGTKEEHGDNSDGEDLDSTARHVEHECLHG
jgi:hypothetical protein